MVEPNGAFRPHPLARHYHFQTVVSSLVRFDGEFSRSTETAMLVETPAGVRLQGYFSPQPEALPRGLVLLLHGWLGSVNSAYVIAIAEALYRHGYAIFRLNLRDHDATHHLNPGIFRSDLLAEVVDAARWIAGLGEGAPLHVVGASLGGNFALRLAWQHALNPIPNLGQTIAVCPVIDPYQTTLALDNGPKIYLVYFRKKWRATFQAKQAAFPDLYEFTPEISASTCMAMTETFARRFSPYADAREYFNSYEITPAMMQAVQSPVSIIAAADDPIIPAADFSALSGLSPHLQVHIQPYGGHVGFIDLFPYRSWLGPAVAKILHNPV